MVIGETQSAMHDPREQYQLLGIDRLAEKFGAGFRALDLSEDRVVRVRVPRPHALKEVELPEKVSKADILINIHTKHPPSNNDPYPPEPASENPHK